MVNSVLPRVTYMLQEVLHNNFMASCSSLHQGGVLLVRLTRGKKNASIMGCNCDWAHQRVKKMYTSGSFYNRAQHMALPDGPGQIKKIGKWIRGKFQSFLRILHQQIEKMHNSGRRTSKNFCIHQALYDVMIYVWCKIANLTLGRWKGQF